MTGDPQGLHVSLARKLAGYDVLSETENQVLERLIRGTRRYDTGQELVGENERPPFSTLLIEGWMARSRTLEDGVRQITAIHIPGDFVDLHGFLLRKLDHSVVALTPCLVATAAHPELKRITEEHPHLTRLLWLSTLVDAAIHRNWIVAMGRLASTSHLAHLFCELYVRLSAVGLAQNCEFEFPLTQPVIADALGLSLVHVNRTVRELREANLVHWRSRTIKILDWEKFVAFAQFDPTYLSESREPR